jgi:hypothetical protein
MNGDIEGQGLFQIRHKQDEDLIKAPGSYRDNVDRCSPAPDRRSANLDLFTQFHPETNPFARVCGVSSWARYFPARRLSLHRADHPLAPGARQERK